MIKTDFVNVNGIEWGKYPYYYGDTYSDGNVYFATFGCKKAIQYKDFVEGNKTIPISEKTDYLSMYNNGGLKKYYGEDILQQKKSLVSRDDFIRTEEKFYAIPTEEELQKLIDNSDIYCYNGKLIIKPYEMNDGIKNYKDEISIPFLGLVEYEKDNTGKYKIKNGEIKNIYSDTHNIMYTYSDIYLLTSTIPRENDKLLYGQDSRGYTLARVFRMTIVPITIDDPSTPEEDVEFMYFDVLRDEDGKAIYSFENIVCGSPNWRSDAGFMVLPIKYEGVVNVKITGNLLLNGIPFLGYNQGANKDVVPYIKINPFGIPEIVNSEYNYTFSKDISDGKSILETSFYLPNGTISTLNIVGKINNIDGDNAKITDYKIDITDTSEEDGNYWILSDNECLYYYSDRFLKYIIFDDRSFFSSAEKTTTINITINTRFKDNYTVGYNRFVLPSIYKPFYIKTLIGVEVFPEDYEEVFVTTTQTNVYNGIGLFAYRGIGHSPNASGTVLDKESELTSNKTQSLPDDLKERLYKYFDFDKRFSENFENFFYNPNVDTYAIGLISSNVKISKSDNTLEFDCSNAPLPIFRQKPLILSDYSDSVFDFVDVVTVYDTSDEYRKNTMLKINKNFNSVIEPHKKMKFNSEREYSTNINFGDLFGKIKGSLVSTGNVITNINNIIQEGREKGIRYYMVNEAFYLNYVYNDEATNEATGFIKYSGEYYNNREYYDLNPHKVDFKHNNIWDSSLGDESERTLNHDEMEKFSGYPENLNDLITSEYVKSSLDSISVNGSYMDTYNVTASASSKELYYAHLPINEKSNFLRYYSMSFWIENTNYATICIRATLANRVGVNGFLTQEEEDSGLAPYETIVIGLNEKRYVTIQGYPFSGSTTIDLFVRPKYKNENTNEYYKIFFKISKITVTKFENYIPFFDMIPALKNTVGYLYSDVKYKDYGGDNEKIDEDKPNFKAPMAAEIYYYKDKDYCIVERQCIKIDGNNDTCDNIKSPTYLIGAYTPLTRLKGGCSTDDFEYDENDNDYVNHIKYGNVILPQEDEVSIIFCYGIINSL